MQLARLMGILFVFGAPAIIGGGLVYHLFHSWFAVWFYEILLICLGIRTAINAAGKPAVEHAAHGHSHDHDHDHDHDLGHVHSH